MRWRDMRGFPGLNAPQRGSTPLIAVTDGQLDIRRTLGHLARALTTHARHEMSRIPWLPRQIMGHASSTSFPDANKPSIAARLLPYDQ